MATVDIDENAAAFDLVHRGYAHQFSSWLLRKSWLPMTVSKILLLLSVTWLPLVVLSLFAGHVFGDKVNVSFFADPEVHVRLLLSLPLLELAEVAIAFSLSVQVEHLLNRGIVGKADRPKFRDAERQILKWRDAGFSEVTLLVLAFAISILSRVFLGISDGTSSWERAEGPVTLAGWWHILVSLPILYFILLRWLLIFALWSVFLYQVSRLDLNLTPTHPDHAGGMGFLGWGLASFSLVLMAVSSVFSAALAAEIYQHGESLNSLKYHIVVFVIIALLVLHAPLMAFSVKLARCRFQGLLQFGALVWEHDRAFDEKWIEHRSPVSGESLLGTPDAQSMSNIAICYQHINEMWPIPFDSKAFAILVLAALLPLLPLLGTQIPLQEIFAKLGEMLI